MTLYSMYALHLQAFCDRCHTNSDLFCGKEIQTARADAIDRLRELGWVHRVPAHDLRPSDWVEREGAGVWYCAECASKVEVTSCAVERASARLRTT